MYDAISASYRFHCPSGPEARGVAVRLSQFRRVERLDGPAHPAVYRVVWACGGCGQDHLGLVTHDELDYAPFAPQVEERVSFWDPLTGRVGGNLRAELAQAAARRLRRRGRPWGFLGSAQERMRPGSPSALAWVAGREQLVGCAVRCATCGETSLTLVPRRPLDEPFFHDRVVHAVERPVGE